MSSPLPPAKIVALIAARNEAERLPFCLRAIARHADAIVYLDDCSDDESVRVVESLAAECRVERIIRKPQWHRDEPGDRNLLLLAGRKIGGTHFLVLDADEAFTANCGRDDHLRRLLLTLRPGERLVLAWIQLWRSLRQYRFDDSPWTYGSKAFAFRDDGRCFYQSEFIHTPRVPDNLAGREVVSVNYVHGVMHFQFVNWPNLQIKQAWYRCLERVRRPERPAAEINAQYAPSEDEAGRRLREVPADWLAGYASLDAAAPAAVDQRRRREVRQWFQQHGVAPFADLDVWRVDWTSEGDDPGWAAEIRQRHRAAREAQAASARESLDVAGLMAAADRHFAAGDLPACGEALQRALARAPQDPRLRAAFEKVTALRAAVAAPAG